MANEICIWDGSTDGDWGTAANWLNTTVPVTTMTAIIPANATVDIDGAGGAEAAFDKLIIEEGCSITIGTRTSAAGIVPLDLTFASETNATAVLAGSGLTYLKLTEAKGITVNHAAAAPGTGEYGLNLTTATATNESPIVIKCSSGESVSLGANANESAKFETIKIHGGDVAIGDTVTEKGASAPDSLSVYGGDVVCDSAIGIVTVYDGTLRQNTGAIATGHAYGGTLFYNSGAALSGTMNIYNGGTFNLDEGLSGTTLNLCKIWPGGTFVDNFFNTTSTISPQQGGTLTYS